MKGTMLSGWWKARSAREQRMLLLLGLVILVVLSWLLVIRPLSDALSEARERHGAATVALAEAKRQAEAVRAAEAGEQPSLAGPVDVVLSQAAAEAGFPITRLDRQSAREATLTLESVRPEAFFPWVGVLESKGLVVERLTAATNSDKTLSVQVTFRARSS